jgi:hypothetical protein
MITKLDQVFEKLKAEKSAENSPNLNEMLGFPLPDGRTTLYFRKTDSSEHIKMRLSKYIKHTSFLGDHGFADNNFIRTKNNKNE